MKNESNIYIGIVVSKFNTMITEALLSGAKKAFVDEYGDFNKKLKIFYVPGAFEIPGTIKKMLNSKNKFDAIIALGSVIKGETPHFEYIASESAHGVAQLSISSNIPIIYGIITTDNMKQALDRVKKDDSNKGWQAMKAGIEMISTYHEIDK